MTQYCSRQKMKKLSIDLACHDDALFWFLPKYPSDRWCDSSDWDLTALLTTWWLCSGSIEVMCNKEGYLIGTAVKRVTAATFREDDPQEEATGFYRAINFRDICRYGTECLSPH